MRTGVKKRGYVSVLRKRPGMTAMELATTPTTERQRKYRENYRERVAGWYNGRLHILLIYTTGFTALYVYIANMGCITGSYAAGVQQALPSGLHGPAHRNGNGWPSRERGVRGTAGHGKIRGLRRSGDGTLIPYAGRADEPIASSGQGLDPILAARLLPKHPT